MARGGKATVTLPSDTEILITREFDAPPHLVWRAYTEPDLVARWWAGRRGEVTSVDIDLRVGGSWRYVMLAHGELEVAFHGEFREIVPGERLLGTEVFEGFPDGEALVEATFAPAAGHRTLLTVLVTHSCREHRDAHVDSGMEGGMQESYDALEGVAQAL